MICCPQDSEQWEELLPRVTGAASCVWIPQRPECSMAKPPSTKTHDCADCPLTSDTLPRDHRGHGRAQRQLPAYTEEPPGTGRPPAHPPITVPVCRCGGTPALVQGLLDLTPSSWPTGVAKDRGHVAQHLWPQSLHTADPQPKCEFLPGGWRQGRTSVFPVGAGPAPGRQVPQSSVWPELPPSPELADGPRAQHRQVGSRLLPDSRGLPALDLGWEDITQSQEVPAQEQV